jgi:DNA-binding NarL/FixJ family response regulator
MKLVQDPTDRIPVWIIDDIESFCEILAEALNRSKTVQCQRYYLSCKTAIQALAAEESPPSVILLDIVLPKLSGLDAIALLKEISPATHIIMLTSHDLDENIRTAINRGADGYLLKTSTPAEIINAIEKVLKGEVPIDEKITKRIMESFLVPREVQAYHLTRREKEILSCVSMGLSVLEMSRKLDISFYTVDTHLKNIHQKLEVHSRQGDRKSVV